MATRKRGKVKRLNSTPNEEPKPSTNPHGEAAIHELKTPMFKPTPERTAEFWKNNYRSALQTNQVLRSKVARMDGIRVELGKAIADAERVGEDYHDGLAEGLRFALDNL